MSFDWNLGQTLFFERGLVTVYSVKDVEEGQKAPNQCVHRQTEHFTSSVKLSLRTNVWLSSMLNALHFRAGGTLRVFQSYFSPHLFTNHVFPPLPETVPFLVSLLPFFLSWTPPTPNPSYLSEANSSSVAQRLAHILFLKLLWPFH